MSEYQYIGFRAIDAPLTDKQLQYMRQQSTRAEITRWSFDNTYHYGDFRGDADEMLRRGYDMHLHYANFGIRHLAIRLPQGLPVPKAQYAKYIDDENVVWQPDRKGPAGILTISPAGDADAFDELWDAESYLDRLIGLRQQLIDGDVRPLYVAWLCGCQSDDIDPEAAVEPPLPAGLAKAPGALLALLEFYGLNPLVLAAAAEQSLPSPEQADQADALNQWLASLDKATLRQWLLRFLSDEPAAVKAACLQALRTSRKASAWPVTKSARSFAQLLARAEELAEAEALREQKRQAQARRRRLADMAKSPQKYLDQVDQHVARRGRDSYEQAAQLLDELREAIGGKEGDKLARKHAAALKKQYPTLNILSGALRRKELL